MCVMSVRYGFDFAVFPFPKSEEELRDLQAQLTGSAGAKGWSMASTSVFVDDAGDRFLFVALQKEVEVPLDAQALVDDLTNPAALPEAAAAWASAGGGRAAATGARAKSRRGRDRG